MLFKVEGIVGEQVKPLLIFHIRRYEMKTHLCIQSSYVLLHLEGNRRAPRASVLVIHKRKPRWSSGFELIQPWCENFGSE